uniref:Cyclooxygenase-like protein n=1 Tax=Phascolosoma agassizii TaxID=360543 RepID=A0A0U2KWQ1_9ANNE|nr:cyclooxygenase-like protein [Phascolosoma agassizii]
MDTNVFFSHFAQHFSHMFLKTDHKLGPAYTWGTHQIDGSNIYGPDEAWRRKLRSLRNGKLRSRMVNGEEWPLSVAEVPVAMRRLPNQRDEDLFALGHEFYTFSPGLIMVSTIWLREHNRVCDVLKAKHPEWDDEQLYQTARNIVTGEVSVLIMQQYVKHVSQYKFDPLLDPTVIFDDGIRFIHSVPYEYNIMYHWHAQATDYYDVGDQRFTPNQFLFNTSIPIDYGIERMVDAAVRQRAGKICGRNHGASTLKVAIETLKQSRQLRTASFNQYRKRFGFEPYTSFTEITGGDRELARAMEDLYGHVDGVELYVGLMLEEPRVGILSHTMLYLAGPTTFQGLMANPLLSNDWWRPSTFGGETGFDIVKGVDLQSLFCRNMKECPRVAFTVPK